jgi:hypothetical protein
MGVEAPVELIEESSLSESDHANVLYRTAETFLGLGSEPAR